jgi:tRNA (cmo5U34)-methyltransferase
MNIPPNWTFKSEEIANGFDSHVREQLPWYDLVTNAVAYLGRHYIPVGGNVYDIGASTGNIGKSIQSTIESRNARFTAVEESQEMAKLYSGPGELVVADACDFDFQPFDFCVVFLVLMFIPISKRQNLVDRLIKNIKPGGCLVVVDKLDIEAGNYGSAMRRLTLQWKINNGADPKKILEKELSLAGYQRPINPEILTRSAKQFFRLGEFAGWIIESSEESLITG